MELEKILAKTNRILEEKLPISDRIATDDTVLSIVRGMVKACTLIVESPICPGQLPNILKIIGEALKTKIMRKTVDHKNQQRIMEEVDCIVGATKQAIVQTIVEMN